jgi:glycosyltransferase involved in cell wall biosynthesis
VKIATLGNASVIHTQRWVEHFRARGHQVRLWSLEPGPPELDVWPLPPPAALPSLRYLSAVPALARGLEEFGPDLVDAHFVPNYGLMAAIVNRHPFSVTAWGSDLLAADQRVGLRRARARFVLRRADLVLADAENLADAARELGAPASRVRCIPWGISLDLFRATGERKRGAILSTRMHESVYDLPTLIEAAAIVLPRHPELELAIAGYGSLRGELEAMAAAKLPAGRFRFLGRLQPETLAEWLARSDLYLSTSLSDSTSLSLLEAMASGAVPVVSDIEGNREWVRDGDGARLFAPGDASSLARAIEAAMADDVWRESARKRKRGVVEARGDWTRNMGRIEGLFRDLAASRGS